MAFTYNVATDAGKVRLLISDTDTTNVLNQIFQDDEIAAFISLASGGNVKRAAGLALLAIAANEVFVQKRIKLLDLSTDGPAEAAALRALCDKLSAQADADDAADDGDFDVSEWVVNDFSYRERIYKEAQRNQ